MKNCWFDCGIVLVRSEYAGCKDFVFMNMSFPVALAATG